MRALAFPTMRLSFALIALSLAACAGAPERASGPRLDIAAYFDRNLRGSGVIERGGEITQRFDMEVTGQVEGDRLTLRETFLFPDKPDFTRTWRLSRTAPGEWKGSAENVRGQTVIRVENGVARMAYVAEFPTDDGSTISLRFDQRLYMMEGETVINVSKLSKFLIPVGTVTVIFRPDEAR